jgi:serine/threonine-protein kinase
MGRVYEAVERATGRVVALKVPDERTLADPRMRERFLKEMQAIAGVSHPHVVPLLRVHLGELPFFAMEYVEGDSYRERVDQHAPMAPADCLPLLRGLASALAFIHGLGIVHQDVKPANLLIDTQGVARLSDFGLAVEIGRNFDARDETGAGSPAYMAPEQFSSAAAQPAADVFAFGVMLFESLAGRRPYPDDRPLSKLTEVAPSLDEAAPGAPPTLVRLTADCLSREIDQRPANGTELLRRLDEVSG